MEDQVCKRTDKWKPASPGGGSQGFPVEIEGSGELGHAKPLQMFQEVLAYELACDVSVNVPRVSWATCDGKLVAVSRLWGEKSMDIPQIRTVSAAALASPQMAAALREASGMLAFHLWVGNGDFKDEHVMVRPGPTQNSYEIACIDFASAFGWSDPNADPGPPAGHPILVQHRDADSIRRAVEHIKSLADERIEAVVNGIRSDQLPADRKTAIAAGLVARKKKIGPGFQAAQWI